MADIIQLSNGPIVDPGFAAASEPRSDADLAKLAGEESTGISQREALLALARRGVPLPVCEAAVGLPRGEVLRWAKLDAEARQWSALVTMAAHRAEAELAASLAISARKDPRVAQWLLERSHPSRWSPDVGREVGQAVGRVVQEVSRLPGVDPEALRAALVRASGG